MEESVQWDGGPDGFKVIRPFLSAAHNYLKENGEIYFILSDLTDMDSLFEEFRSYNFNKLGEDTFETERIVVFSARTA